MTVIICVMPYKDPKKHARNRRNHHRKNRHGADWRGILEYYGRACANINNPEVEGECLENKLLELHEPFGEDKAQQGKMQLRILLCRYCHCREHDWKWPLTRGGYTMMLEDTDAEIEEEGSIEAWERKYRVGESLGRVYNG